MEHLTDREIYDFLCVDTVCENTMAMGNRINSHILCCADCAEKYKAALAAYEAATALLELDDVDCTFETLATEISFEAVARQAELLELEYQGCNRLSADVEYI